MTIFRACFATTMALGLSAVLCTCAIAESKAELQGYLPQLPAEIVQRASNAREELARQRRDMSPVDAAKIEERLLDAAQSQDYGQFGADKRILPVIFELYFKHVTEPNNAEGWTRLLFHVIPSRCNEFNYREPFDILLQECFREPEDVRNWAIHALRTLLKPPGDGLRDGTLWMEDYISYQDRKTAIATLRLAIPKPLNIDEMPPLVEDDAPEFVQDAKPGLELLQQYSPALPKYVARNAGEAYETVQKQIARMKPETAARIGKLLEVLLCHNWGQYWQAKEELREMGPDVLPVAMQQYLSPRASSSFPEGRPLGPTLRHEIGHALTSSNCREPMLIFMRECYSSDGIASAGAISVLENMALQGRGWVPRLWAGDYPPGDDTKPRDSREVYISADDFALIRAFLQSVALSGPLKEWGKLPVLQRHSIEILRNWEEGFGLYLSLPDPVRTAYFHESKSYESGVRTGVASRSIGQLYDPAPPAGISTEAEKAEGTMDRRLRRISPGRVVEIEEKYARMRQSYLYEAPQFRQIGPFDPAEEACVVLMSHVSTASCNSPSHDDLCLQMTLSTTFRGYNTHETVAILMRDCFSGEENLSTGAMTALSLLIEPGQVWPHMGSPVSGKDRERIIKLLQSFRDNAARQDGLAVVRQRWAAILLRRLALWLGPDDPLLKLAEHIPMRNAPALRPPDDLADRAAAAYRRMQEQVKKMKPEERAEVKKLVDRLEAPVNGSEEYETTKRVLMASKLPVNAFILSRLYDAKCAIWSNCNDERLRVDDDPEPRALPPMQIMTLADQLQIVAHHCYLTDYRGPLDIILCECYGTDADLRAAAMDAAVSILEQVTEKAEEIGKLLSKDTYAEVIGALKPAASAAPISRDFTAIPQPQQAAIDGLARLEALLGRSDLLSPEARDAYRKREPDSER